MDDTLPAHFYKSPSIFEACKELIFAKSWQLACDVNDLNQRGQVIPITLLPGYLDEPVVLSRDDKNEIHCLANVCTHRGNLLVEETCEATSVRCRYHGRRFALDGKMLSAPGFEGTQNFPTENDNLSKISFGQWSRFLFVAVNPAFSLAELIQDMEERLCFLPLDKFRFAPELSRQYETAANWALYVDNYLEGMHIPYVHPALAASLDIKDYKTEIFAYSNLQIGLATDPKDAFALPESSKDFGKNVAAYYYWLFPNMMFNFYPWGLSINIVSPLEQARTKISYLSYVYDESKIRQGAGADTDRTEREDQAIIEQVQKGIASRYYDRGRYAIQWEMGLHHFHGLVENFLQKGERLG